MTSPYKPDLTFDADHNCLCSRKKCKKKAYKAIHNDPLCKKHYVYEKDLLRSAVKILEDMLMEEE